jgi:hypothetical protein
VKRLPKFSRRAWLGGAGAILSLPLLESLLPKNAVAADPALRRLVTFFVPNGMHMDAWTPTTQGTGFTLSPILAPLVNVQDKILVVTGLDNEPARPDGLGDHAAGTGGFLTCRHVEKTEGANIKNGISMDQVAAGLHAQYTRIHSLQLGIDGGTSAGDCDSGYSCAYARNISWASDTQPLPKTVNPMIVWDLMFSGFDPTATAEELAKRKLYRTSILDNVLDQATTLSGKLGKTDKLKLDEYMNSVRELEKKIEKTGTGPQCTALDKPPASYSYEEHVQIMIDLMVVALQCDSTRVISFMLGNAGSNRSYPFLGVPEAHHEISHHQDNPANFAKLQIIDEWEIKQLAYMLEKMAAIQEAPGVSLLDSSIVYFSSEIEDGNSHAHHNLPILIAGSGGGTFTTGRHVVSDHDPLANLYISILQAMGVDAQTFGDNGTGPLPNL